jgi:hypothetical protein
MALSNNRKDAGGREPTAFDLILECYRKTFVGIQVTIGVVTLAALLQTHRLIAAFAFFAIMQIGAIFGAMWAARLKSRIEHGRANLRA